MRTVSTPARRAAGSAVLVLLAAAGPTIAPASAAEPGLGDGTVTSVTMVSESGDYIGGGGARLYHPGNAAVTLQGTPESVTVEVSGGALGDAYTLRLAAPRGEQLRPGDYAGAQRASLQAAGRPGIDVSGDGRGCNTVSGRFTVRDIGVTHGRVDRLHVLYEQHCEAGAPALFGEIRYRVPAAGSQPVLVAPAEIAWPSSYPGEPARPVPVTLVNPGPDPVPVGDPAVTGSSAPAFRVVSDQCEDAVPAGGTCVVYVRFVPLTPGLRSAALVVPVGAGTATVRLTGEGETGTTSWQMRGDTGEWVSGGRAYSWTAADAVITASGSEVLVTVGVDAADGWYTAEFAAGRNDVLLPGVTYTDARRYPFNSVAPGLAVTGSGRGCNTSLGAFTVHDVAFGPRGLERFSASFEQLCDGLPQPLVGAVAYRAVAPPPPVPGMEPPDPPEAPLFRDTAGTTHGTAIELVAAAGIARGYADGTFRPDLAVTRGQMAAFLDRALGLPDEPGPGFDDTAGHVHEVAIGRLAAAGITVGYGRAFRPDGLVTRDQMATFLDRAVDLPAAAPAGFRDTGGNVHAAAIDRLAAAGITTGYADRTYRPALAVTRGQMASFLVRALAE